MDQTGQRWRECSRSGEEEAQVEDLDVFVGPAGPVLQEATFEAVGPLGITWMQGRMQGETLPFVKGVKPDGAAALAGLVDVGGLGLGYLNGECVLGLEYADVIEKVRAVRPLTFSFVDAGGLSRRPGPVLESWYLYRTKFSTIVYTSTQ